LSSQKSDAHVLHRQASLRGRSPRAHLGSVSLARESPGAGDPTDGLVSRRTLATEETIVRVPARVQIGVTSTPAKVFLPRRSTSQEPPTRSLTDGTSSASSTRWLLR